MKAGVVRAIERGLGFALAALAEVALAVTFAAHVPRKFLSRK